MTRNILPLILCTLTEMVSRADEPPFKDVSSILAPILEKSELPSLAGAVVIGDEICGIGAVGVRKMGDPTLVTLDDKYHIGSCTKPMTATLVAILVEEGLLKWESTIGEVLGKEIRSIHPDLVDVTVEQLLSHVGGLSASPPQKIWLEAWKNQGEMPAIKQRKIFVSDLLSEKPAYAPGTKTEYSNQGYAVVGVMLETLTKTPWQKLLTERIFVPLGMKSAGFRAPCSSKKLDQPWGHAGKKPVAPEPQGDNPDAIGPAGTVHVSIGDWAKFARFHLNRKTDGILKRVESFEKLNSTLENSGKSGVGGWLVHDLVGFGGHCIQMTGSNTMWYAMLWVFPGDNMAVVVAANAAPESAFGTCDQAVVALRKKFLTRTTTK